VRADDDLLYGQRQDLPLAVPSPATWPSRDGEALRAHRLLERALQRCLADPQPGRDAGTGREQWLQEIVGCAHTVIDGRPADARGLPAGLALRRLAGELRLQVLDVASERSDEGTLQALVDAIRALERVVDECEADPARRFAGQLTDMNALELVIAAAHDMRSPLASIQFLVDTLRQGHSGPLTPTQSRQLLLVHSAAFGLGALARDLIDLASSGSRLLEPESRPFSMRECLQGVEDLARPMAEEKALQLTFESPDVDYRVGQPIALSRVLLNLTTNALKFTEVGAVRVSALEVSRSRLEFKVEDTGRGISADVLASLFDAFRLRQRTQDYVFSSAGLGLSICQTLVTAMGGELSVDTTPGRGTCFGFQLQLPPAERAL